MVSTQDRAHHTTEGNMILQHGKPSKQTEKSKIPFIVLSDTAKYEMPRMGKSRDWNWAEGFLLSGALHIVREGRWGWLLMGT